MLCPVWDIILGNATHTTYMLQERYAEKNTRGIGTGGILHDGSRRDPRRTYSAAAECTAGLLFPLLQQGWLTLCSRLFLCASTALALRTVTVAEEQCTLQLRKHKQYACYGWMENSLTSRMHSYLGGLTGVRASPPPPPGHNNAIKREVACPRF